MGGGGGGVEGDRPLSAVGVKGRKGDRKGGSFFVQIYFIYAEKALSHTSSQVPSQTRGYNSILFGGNSVP